ncbi:MAG: 3-ketoacyl-ACP synthase [Bdellovibrio sp. ArHS]|uniref:ketoacyl-ACP synthase III n=1 Tax=Bdellovibrio sp. ArHS TaxID=1569284 RepID=UPI00058373A3|nr:ketoacyl-ACP synthase III [Bdellovibrio sp. ArHS]KHD87395.1 MAG: 3-ketoacyl-ACP synthase [Bdellovibrio sp. ArHS]
MSKRTATIVGTGMYAPERVISNQYFNDLYKKDIGTFLSESRNIRERRWMDKDQRTSDLILPAAEEAMKNAGITAKDLDLIIVSTDTPDYLSPSTASVVAYRMGAVNAGTYDINTACAGFVVGCDIASKYIAADEKYKNILVVGAYGMSKYLNFDDYKIASLFADGAGAVVIQPAKDTRGFIDSQMYTDGQYHDYMGIYAGGTAQPVTHEVIENKGHLLAFPKRIPPETNGIHWPRLTNMLLDRLHMKPDDINHFFITQFNVQSIYETLDKLNLPRERAHYVMDRFGYTGSASIGMAIADAARQKKMKKGDMVFMLGSGGGMSMAALALEWGYDT